MRILLNYKKKIESEIEREEIYSDSLRKVLLKIKNEILPKNEVLPKIKNKEILKIKEILKNINSFIFL
jgi:hypothetical protein